MHRHQGEMVCNDLYFQSQDELASKQCVLPVIWATCDRFLRKFVDTVNGKCQQIPNKVR